MCGPQVTRRGPGHAEMDPLKHSLSCCIGRGGCDTIESDAEKFASMTENIKKQRERPMFGILPGYAKMGIGDPPEPPKTDTKKADCYETQVAYAIECYERTQCMQDFIDRLLKKYKLVPK